MIFNTFITSAEDLSECSGAPGLDEVLIETKELAREGQLDSQQAEDLAAQARKLGLKTVLVWDILMTQKQSLDKNAIIRKIRLDNFNSIRAQCPGAAAWIRQEFPEKDLHFIVENSNHNLSALKRWEEQLNPKRLILSAQIPEGKLIHYCQELKVECEVLGAGKLLLFYSPRSLLSSDFEGSGDSQGQRWIYADSLSEESLSRPFPTIENQHGTFMYLNKDHFILHKLQGLQEAGFSTVRIDLRPLKPVCHSAQGIADICRKIAEKDPALPETWPRPSFAPFFRTNKTDKQFGKLKSRTRIFRDQNCLAEVVSADRGKLIAFYALQDFKPGEEDYLVLQSDGKQISLKAVNFCNLAGEKLDFVRSNQLIIISWVKGLRTGSLLIRSNND